MNQSNASLETSKPTPQANSKPANSADGKVADAAAPDQQAPAAKETAKPRTLAEMFGNPEDPESQEIDLSETEPDDPSKPADTLEKLMKRTKMTAEQAYAIKITLPTTGETLTIGEMKDRVGDLVDFEYRQTEFDERRIAQEGEMLRAQSELKDLLSMLPKDAVKPEVIQAVRNKQDATIKRERGLTLQHIPEWRDEPRRTKEIEGITEMLGEYGFAEGFIASVVDHRALKFMRDAYLIRQRIKKSLADARDPARRGIQRPSGKVGKPAVRPSNQPAARRSRQARTQRDVITDWLNSRD